MYRPGLTLAPLYDLDPPDLSDRMEPVESDGAQSDLGKCARHLETFRKGMLRIAQEGEARPFRAIPAIWRRLAAGSGKAVLPISTDGEDGGTDPELIPDRPIPRIHRSCPAGVCPAQAEALLQAKDKPVEFRDGQWQLSFLAMC